MESSCCSYPHMPSTVIPCRLQRLLLFHSQIRQDLRLVFSGCDNLMACGAIIGNGLAVGTGMVTIVAAEAAQRIHVAEVIWVRPPGHAHPREDIAEIDCRNLFARLLHQRALRPINLRVIRSIEIGERVADTLLRYIASGIIHLEKFDRLLLDVGNSLGGP